MAETVRITVEPEVLDLYHPPKAFERIWNLGSVYSHQYAALTTESRAGRIHAPTATGKSRAAAFFAVSPFHLGKSDLIKATFAYPTNILTSQQFERSLIEGLVENLRYKDKGKNEWRQSSTNNTTIPYRRLEIPEGGELRIAKLTGADVADILQDDAVHGGKADILQEFLDWLNQGHSFLVCSPDLIAYAVHEIYGSSSLYYHSTVKKRLHSLLRGRTFILDEYHQYDPFTLINLERLLADENLAPSRALLLSATERKDYFPDIQNIVRAEILPDPIDRRTASREIFVDFHFGEHIPEPESVNSGLTLFIHDSVIQNRSRSKRLRALGIPVVQWDGTRKDLVKNEELGLFYHLIMGTAAIEVGLDTDADSLITEWNPSWTTPDRTIQRIGRVGRRESPDPAQVEIYMPGALDVLSNKISEHRGQRMTKNQLSALIHEVSVDQTINRRDYVSNYYFSTEGQKILADRGLLHSHEKLRYSFRPPGSQALFLDRTEGEPFLFLYGRAQMLNRYDKRPPTPDDLAFVNEGWKRLCDGLGLRLEENDFFVIIGEKKQREWLRVPDGTIEDLKRPDMRKYYVERQRRL
jgi:hypothetical protein